MSASPGEWARFPCGLGDVLVRNLDGAEAWLASAIVLSEDAPRAALFVAPERSVDVAIFAWADRGGGVAWLAPVAGVEANVRGEPPSAIEIAGARFERKRRLPLHARCLGDGAPDLGETVILAEYAAGATCVIAIAGPKDARVWRGEWLAEGAYDVLPGGGR